ncbi:Suf-domain-containing protein [Laetiporus sulphureus 93-53]|uniref:mRNA 3'-end-processing protein RNA14 n=1 Tax=Laetiporus sulphureus 93-53 TaxID=1314785 RepID=A0A165BVJ3_9APHY|nr:Suf-domain-containing protein [Laetiporus sulphureus 93-53]KZT01729.1 Suf-domain-containing protein [Laetiporus sulphureus 93-53]
MRRRSRQRDDISNVVRQINPDSLPRLSSIYNVRTVKQEPTPPPPSEYDQLRTQLRQKPFEADTWLRLVDIAEDSGNIEMIKETYEGLLEAYPNTSSAQIAYLNHFLDNPETFGFAESLFKRFLRTSSSVDLWKVYLTYVRRVNTGPNARDVVRKSYEYALNHIGQDKDSSEIWTEYIQFLRSGETTTTWEEQQKLDAIRKAYSRAAQAPMENTKKLWKEYQDFENSLNKITAKKFLSNLQQGHIQARTVLSQLQEHLTMLFSPPPPSRTARPPIWLPRQPEFNARDKTLVGRWQAYLKWEEGNPLEIEEKDKATLHSRLKAVYRKAIVRMRFFSEIWYMAYVWTNSIGKTDEALAILKAGIDANPSSFVLNFAYAEALEIRQNYSEVHATFTKFLDVLRQDPEEVERRVSAENSSPSTAPNSQREPLNPPSQFSPFVSQVSEERPSKNKELHERRTDYGIAWIMYMRFGRRAEGLKSSRAVFGKARRDRWTPWEVFEAAALMEYHCTKTTDVASRIFEKGMGIFGDEVEFVIHYLGFLISLNDENNARALFERVVRTLPPDRARPLWERWSRHVHQFGDLDASRKLEARMAEAYPTDPPIKCFAERYKYLGTDAIAVRDLGFTVSRQGSMNHGCPDGSTLGRTDAQLSLMFNASTTQDESRESDFGPPSKRQRPASRERDMWDGRRRRHGTPPWQRDRSREGPLRRFSKEEKEENPVMLPPVLSWFVSVLPEPTAFDGPIFRTDDLMQVFRNVVIPSTSSVSRVRTPAPPPRAGKLRGGPPPDYGPYQRSGRRGRF